MYLMMNFLLDCWCVFGVSLCFGRLTRLCQTQSLKQMSESNEGNDYVGMVNIAKGTVYYDRLAALGVFTPG